MNELKEATIGLELLGVPPNPAELRDAVPRQARSTRLGIRLEAPSLLVLTRQWRRGNRWEDAVWAALGISSLVLLAFSFWL